MQVATLQSVRQHHMAAAPLADGRAPIMAACGSPARRGPTPWYLSAYPHRDPYDRDGAWETPRPADAGQKDWYAEFYPDKTPNDWGQQYRLEQAKLIANMPQPGDGPLVKLTAEQQAILDEAEKFGRRNGSRNGSRNASLTSEQQRLLEEARKGSRNASLTSEQQRLLAEARKDPSRYHERESEASASDSASTYHPTYMDKLENDPRLTQWNGQWSELNIFKRAISPTGARMSPEERRQLAFRTYAVFPSPPPSGRVTPVGDTSPSASPRGDLTGGRMQQSALPQALPMAGINACPGDIAKGADSVVPHSAPLGWSHFDSLCDSLVKVREERLLAFQNLQHAVPGQPSCIHGFDLPMALASAGFSELDEEQLEQVRNAFRIAPGVRVDFRVFDAVCSYLASDAAPAPRPGSPMALDMKSSSRATPVPGHSGWQAEAVPPPPPKKKEKEKPAKAAAQSQAVAAMVSKVDLPPAVASDLRFQNISSQRAAAVKKKPS